MVEGSRVDFASGSSSHDADRWDPCVGGPRHSGGGEPPSVGIRESKGVQQLEPHRGWNRRIDN